MFKGAFTQDITDSLGLKISAGAGASEKLSTEIQISWKIIDNVAVYVKGGYTRIDYEQNGLTDKYGNIWSGGIGLEWTFGGAAKTAVARSDRGRNPGNEAKDVNRGKVRAAGLLQEVVQNPAIRSERVIAAVDQSTTRLVYIDKTVLPAGSNVNEAGDISTTVAAGTIAGITRNGAVFVNTGQFALAGGVLTIITSKIEEPAV